LIFGLVSPGNPSPEIRDCVTAYRSPMARPPSTEASRHSVTHTKPNALGEVKTVHRDASGKVVGQSTSAVKPNALGEVRTTSKGSGPLELLP
jgi:hypothetical protein